MSSSPYIYFTNNDPLVGLGITINKSAFIDLVKKVNLKSDDIIPMLVVLRDRALNKYYAIDVPVAVSDVVPYISVSMPQLAGNEISYKISTTAIHNEDTSLFGSTYKYRRSGFRFDANYDANSLEYLGFNFENSIVKNLTHNITVTDQGGSLVFSDTTLQPVTGEGELVTLRFKDMGRGLGTLSAGNFGYIVWSESGVGGSFSSGYMSYPDIYNIMVGNEVIEIGNKNKAGKLSVQLFPNPAVENLSIDAGFDNYSIVLYSVDGRLIRSVHSVNSSLTMPVSKLTKGIYFVKITKNGESQNLKFIKK
jgi:hypothetical protein